MKFKARCMRAFFMRPMKKSLRILEISIPHATQAGTLQAAMHLPKKIAESGFNTVFVLPWMKVNRALSRSPYACTDYFDVNDTLGCLDDVRQWIKQCHSAGLRVVLDMPLNHTSPEHHWTINDDWYCTDEHGSKLSPSGTDWNDVVQLNHTNTAVVKACEDVLRFWLHQGIDGFRFDAASFISDAVLEGWITFAQGLSQQDLLFWCDGEEYRRSRPFFNGFLHHEAIAIARQNFAEWERRAVQVSDDAIFYLTNHDTLHAGKCPLEEWPKSYHHMRNLLEASANDVLLSWSDWQNPSTRYSFMLEK